MPRQRKSDPPARLCCFLNFGCNYGRDCHKLLDAETGKVVFSRDVMWHHPEAPLILPATVAANPPAAPPEDIYVPMPTPVPIPPAPASTPAPASVPAPAPIPASTTPPLPSPMSNSSAQISPRISRELAHEGYVEMPGRTRGEIRALRDASREFAHHHGLPLDLAVMVSMLDKGEGINECFNAWGGGDTTILSPGRSPKQPHPGIGLHDPPHGRQACPEFNSFHQGVDQTSSREGLFSCLPLPKRGQNCDIPNPPIVECVKRYCAPTRRLSGPADRACIRPTYAKQCVRRREVASCRHLATLHVSRVQWSSTGGYFCTEAGVALSRIRDRC